MKHCTPSTFLASLALCTGFALSAAAQSADQAPPAQDQAAPPHSPTGSTAPQQAARPGTLSNELSHTRGVIQPPPTGDHSVVPPPHVGSGSTPVIPPPGTPGGNQEVEPK